MIKTDDLNEYVLLSVIKNFCDSIIDKTDCSECKMGEICDYGFGSKTISNLDIKYEPDDKKEKNIYDIRYKFSEKKDEDVKNGQ